MTKADYLLLKYLSQFENPVNIEKAELPFEIRTNYKQNGRMEDSVYGHLHRLKQSGYIRNPYVKMYGLTDDGKEAVRRCEDSLPKPSYAQNCDTILRFLIAKEEQGASNLSTVTIAQECEIDYKSVLYIVDDFHKQGLILISENDDEYIVHEVTSDGHRFALRTSFVKEEESKSGFKIFDSFNTTHKVNSDNINTNTTHGTNSPIATAGATQATNVQPEQKETEKKKWWQPIIEALQKPLVAAITAALPAFTGGLLAGKGCNQVNSQLQTQSKPETAKIADKDTASYNKNILSLDSTQKPK